MAIEDTHAEDTGGLPQLALETWPGQVFWLLVAFGVLYFVLSRSLLRPLAGVIEDRRDKIADDLDEATRLNRQAEEAERAFERSLADARARAHTLATQTREKLAEEIAADSAAVDAELNKRAAAAEARIHEAVSVAKSNIPDIAQEAASAIIERISGAAPSASAVQRQLDALHTSGQGSQP